MLSIFHVLIDLWISSLKTCLFRFLAHFLIGLFVFLLLAGKNSNFEKSSLDSVNSVTQSRLTLQPHGLQHARLPCPPSTARACSNSCLLSLWYHQPLSPPSPPAFNLSQHQDLFQWVSSSHLVAKVLELHSAWASVLPMNIQDWSPLGWTGWISLQVKGLSRVFSNTTLQKH